MTTPCEPLRETIERRLSQRWDTAQITVLARARPPLDLTGVTCTRPPRGSSSAGAPGSGPAPTPWSSRSRRERRSSPPCWRDCSAGTPWFRWRCRAGAHSDRLAHVMGDCDATALLCLAEHRPAILRHLGGAEGRHALPRVAAIDAPEDAPITPRRGADAAPGPAIIQYTSGSTRLPKGVRIFGEQILANAELVIRNWDSDASSRFVNWLPHYHDMGLMGGVLYPVRKKRGLRAVGDRLPVTYEGMKTAWRRAVRAVSR